MVMGEDADTSPWREGKAELVEGDMLISEDERTVNFLKEVANTIHQYIRVKCNFPSKNTDGKMTLLDLKLLVHEGKKVFHSLLKRSQSKHEEENAGKQGLKTPIEHES